MRLEGIYNIFSCKKTILNNIRQCVEELGFKVEKFVFSPCYAGEVLVEKKEGKRGRRFAVGLGGGIDACVCVCG